MNIEGYNFCGMEKEDRIAASSHKNVISCIKENVTVFVCWLVAAGMSWWYKGVYELLIVSKHKWAIGLKCSEGISLKQAKTAFRHIIPLPNEWLGSVGLSIVRVSPKMNTQNLGLPDSGFSRMYIVTPVVPSTQIPITESSAELKVPDHSMNLAIPVLSDLGRSTGFSCTAGDLRQPPSRTSGAS